MKSSRRRSHNKIPRRDSMKKIVVGAIVGLSGVIGYKGIKAVSELVQDRSDSPGPEASAGAHSPELSDILTYYAVQLGQYPFDNEIIGDVSAVLYYGSSPVKGRIFSVAMLGKVKDFSIGDPGGLCVDIEGFHSETEGKAYSEFILTSIRHPEVFGYSPGLTNIPSPKNVCYGLPAGLPHALLPPSIYEGLEAFVAANILKEGNEGLEPMENDRAGNYRLQAQCAIGQAAYPITAYYQCPSDSSNTCMLIEAAYSPQVIIDMSQFDPGKIRPNTDSVGSTA